MQKGYVRLWPAHGGTPIEVHGDAAPRLIEKGWKNTAPKTRAAAKAAETVTETRTETEKE